MKIFKYKGDIIDCGIDMVMETHYYTILCYESNVFINIGDMYFTDLFGGLIGKCSSNTEVQEANYPRVDDGNTILIGGADYHTHCYKIHTIIETDKEGFSKFYVTRDFSSPYIDIWNPDNSNPLFDEDEQEWDSLGHPQRVSIKMGKDGNPPKEYKIDTTQYLWWSKLYKIDLHAGDFLDVWVHSSPNSIENRDWKITYNNTK